MENGDGAVERQPESVWYAHVFAVGHNAYEFKIECGKEAPEDELVRAWLRVIASPSNARTLFRLLGVSLLQYADRFGPIDEDGAGESVRDAR